MGWRLWTSDRNKGMQESPPNASHPLLDHKAWVTSDEAVVRMYDLRCSIAPKDLLFMPRGHSITLDDYDAGVATQQWISTHQLLTQKQRDQAGAEFTRRTLPNKILPWLREQCTPDKFRERMAENIKVNICAMLGGAEGATFSQWLAQRLSKSFPNIETLKEYYTPEAQARLQADIKFSDHFLSAVANTDLKKGSQKLRMAREIQAVCEETNMVNRYNFAVHHAPFNSGSEIGLSDEQIQKIVGYESSDPPIAGKPAEIKINTAALAEAAQERMAWARHTLPGQFRASLAEVGKKIDEMRATLRTENLDLPALSEEQARRELNNTLLRVPEHSLATRLMRVGLSNPRLNVVIVPGSDVNAYWSEFGRKDIQRLEKDSVAGYSQGGAADRVYVSTGTNLLHMLDVTVEELLHNSIKNLYASHTTHAPYPDSVAAMDSSPVIHDPRRALFIEALRSDMNRIGRNQDIIRHDLVMPKPLYNGSDFHAEVVVKILKMKALGHWTDAHSRRYKHLSHYIDQVVAQDIAGWERDQAAGKAFSIANHPIDHEAIRSALPPVLTRQAFTKGKPITKEIIGGQSYYILNGDSFAFMQRMDPDKMIAMALPSAPRIHSDTPMPDKITLRDTPEGVLVAVPEALVARLHPRLRDGFENGQKVSVPPPLPPRKPSQGGSAAPTSAPRDNAGDNEWQAMIENRNPSRRPAQQDR
jgi:hypothetical protein